MLKKWQTKKSTQIVDSTWVKLRKDEVVLPNNKTINDFYVVSIKEAAAIVALDKKGNILLKKEYRYTYDEELIEIPAGCYEENESDSLAVAKRELLEETGYCSDEWIYLGSTIESSAKLTNHIHLYLANNCQKISEQKLDETEELELLIVPLEAAVEMVMNNKICCNSSSVGILKVARLLNK